MNEQTRQSTEEEDADAARFGHLRVEPRDSMFLLAAIRRPGGAETPIKVRNLSAGGMMAECTVNFARGETIEVDLRGIGWVVGKVAWGTAGRFGVAFEAVIDPKLARKPISSPPPTHLVKTQKMMWRPGLGSR